LCHKVKRNKEETKGPSRTSPYHIQKNLQNFNLKKPVKKKYDNGLKVPGHSSGGKKTEFTIHKKRWGTG